MALEAVQLDDLNWRDMVLAIRRRIAAASSQHWTHHAPVDPGVTILELYAYLLEQRVFWMDQVPDPFVRSALKLLGESIKPTQCASTVFAFDSADFLEVPRRTELRLQKDAAIVFTTDVPFARLPVARISLEVAGVDHTVDLEHGRLVPLFPFDETLADIKITLWLASGLPTPVPAAPLSLLFDLRTPAKIQPQWSADRAFGIQPPAELRFLYRRTSGQTLVPFARVHDGTGGLRRSGILRLAIPADWQPEGPPQNGLLPYAIFVRVSKSSFTTPPLLRRLIANVAIGRHRRRAKALKPAVQWLPLPGNEVHLAVSPEGFGKEAVLERSVALYIREREDICTRWRRTSDLAFHGSADRVFVTDRQKNLLRFGNGLTGRLPVPSKDATDKVEVRYRVGGGPTGNVGQNHVWEVTVGSETFTVRNVVAATGGVEAESIESARRRVGAALKRVTRAITDEDYKQIAITTPGIAIERAHAAIGHHPLYPCKIVPGAVTVFVVPDAPHEDRDERFEASAGNPFVAAPIADPGALAAIRSRMNTARLITSEVFVRSPRYRPVALTITLQSDVADPSTIEKNVRQRLQTFLDPLVGGDRRRGWPFGEPLRPPVLLRESQAAVGDAAEAISVLITLLDTKRSNECSDVEIGENELVVLKQIRVRVQPVAGDRSPKGGLR